MTLLKRTVTWTLGLVALLALAKGGAGAPGVHGGRPTALSAAPNSLSSQASLHTCHPNAATTIDPLPLRGTPAEALALLRGPAQAIPGACVVTQGDDHL